MRPKNGSSSLMRADINVFVEFSEAAKHNKRHTESDGNKPETHLSGKEACVLLTADERTTGVQCCINVGDYACLSLCSGFLISSVV